VRETNLEAAGEKGCRIRSTVGGTQSQGSKEEWAPWKIQGWLKLCVKIYPYNSNESPVIRTTSTER
jgi:hypothetical protein